MYIRCLPLTVYPVSAAQSIGGHIVMRRLLIITWYRAVSPSQARINVTVPLAQNHSLTPLNDVVEHDWLVNI